MDTVFFVASKLVGALLQPASWIVIALAIVVLSMALGRRRLALWLGTALLGMLVMFSIVPLGDLMLQPIERRYPAHPALDRVDGILVLGGGEDARASLYWGQMQLNDGAERYTAALELAQRFPQARLVFTGGSGALRDLAGADVSEGAMAERFFLGLGVAPGRLLIEDRARNTAENARLSLALANPGPEEAWVLVTSAFHMPRAMRSFEAAGWAGLTPWPVDYRTAALSDGIGWNLTRNLGVLGIALREQVGQLAYRLSGR
jgi:uncharacterized SAM-binding protein YcdF (DUF218 family)